MSGYPYTDRDLLEDREHYHYSALGGPEFLEAWRTARERVRAGLPDGACARRGRDAGLPAAEDAGIETDDLLSTLEARPDPAWIDRLVQRFEVTKRIHPRYDPGLRKGAGDYRDLTRYARLAVLLADGVGGGRNLPWLNALFKLNDLLISQPAARRYEVGADLARTIAAEIAAVDEMERGLRDVA
ncbi:hypothetical protein MWU52_12705 [Jannaschia sp. S6380]|uniref:hypothetical protein n=1 Tax=Jannaschia sp. S6380 TaxID=2926408 RepID=UPI001FF6E3A2|nr:hypothetical protein [Jannaschia sp. S6380]MCK0168417.1 hypothetical protein [Jannaschia sp. S6380]